MKNEDKSIKAGNVIQAGKAVKKAIRTVEIKEAFIELAKLLKFENLVASGGEAKVAITEGRVLVNGVVETHKSKKIYSGDIVEYQNEKIRLCAKETSSND